MFDVLAERDVTQLLLQRRIETLELAGNIKVRNQTKRHLQNGGKFKKLQLELIYHTKQLLVYQIGVSEGFEWYQFDSKR